MPSEETWSQIIRYERLRCGLSQAEAAAEMGIDERTLRDWETGRHFPNYDGQRRLRKIYGKTLEELGLLRL